MSRADMELRMALAGLMMDLSSALSDASHAAESISELLEVTDGEYKQRRVKASLRDDAIDDLLKKEGYTW